MKNSSDTILHMSAGMGVIVGGLIWLVTYAINVGSIEFDGPAEIALALSLLAGGLSFGFAAITYNKIKYKLRLTKVASDLLLMLLTIISVSFVVGLIISSYAQNKWSYPALHQSECTTRNPPPAFCD